MNDHRNARNLSATNVARPGIPRTAPRDGSAAQLLVERARDTPDRPVLAVPQNGRWEPLCARAVLLRARAIAKGFVAAGLQPGEHVAILSRTRYEWTIVDFAIWIAGLISVPVYETSSSEQIRYILGDSEAVAIVLENAAHRERVRSLEKDLPLLRLDWSIDDGGLGELEQLGALVPDADIDRRIDAVQPGDDATVIYTSGSTGRPKGCVLRHDNFTHTVRSARKAMPEIFTDDASTLLFIPLAHVYARFIAVLALANGVLVGHEPDTTHLMEAVGSFHPTFLLAVPRVFEKIYNAAEQQAATHGQAWIFRMASNTAVAHSEATAAGHVSAPLAWRFRLFDRLVYRRLREAMGGSVRFAISGSAPLSPRLSHFFRSTGVRILEGYGLTETTAPATVNRVSELRIGTVGRALPGVEISIGDDSEILIRGVDVFDRYWRNPEATAAARTADGWFRTGDLGTLDADDILTVTGRLKELIVTASGKNVAPAPLEDAIRAHPLVGEVVVVGEGRPFIAALITIDQEMLPDWCASRKIVPPLTVEQATSDKRVLDALQTAVDTANRLVSRAESVRSFTVLNTAFTEASGHLTPKLTVRRAAILRDFADEINRIYAGSGVQTTALPVVASRPKR